MDPLLYPQSVSIVVPCYNCAEFVLLAFESFERSCNLLHDLVRRLGTRYGAARAAAPGEQQCACAARRSVRTRARVCVGGARVARVLAIKLCAKIMRPCAFARHAAGPWSARWW